MHPLPNTEPTPRPAVVPEPSGPARKRRNLLIPLLVIVAVGAGLYLLRDQFMPAANTGGPGGISAVKTAVAASGTIERTIRLTGTTTAERYVSVTAPQLRGGRGGGSVTVTASGGGMMVQMSSGGGGGGGGGNRGGSSGSGSSSSSSSAASSSSSASSTGASSGSGTSAMGSSGSGTSASSGFRGSSSNRFGGSSSSASSASSSSRSSSSAASSASAGSSSSGGSSGGSGGGGGDVMSGGASDFLQVLQKTATPGKIVRKGEVVAEFDRQYQEARLDDYRATVEQGERNLKKVDAELDVSRKAHEFSIEQARANVEKAKLDVRTIPVRSQIEAEVLRLQLEEAEAQLKQLLSEVPYKRESERSQKRTSELDLAESRKELQQAERNVQRMMITAPMDGMVVMQNIFRGGEFLQIKEGDQLFPGQMFMQIVDPSSMLVAATVNQADVENIRVGARAHLHFDAYPGLSLPGKVVSIGAITRPGGQRANFLKEIPVFLKIEKLDGRVIPDMSVSVDVVVDAKQDQVIAPRESVFRDGGDSAPYVYVRTANGFEKRVVETGLFNYVKTAIVNGLKAGEVIAVEKPASEAGKKETAASPGVNNNV